MRTLVTQMRLKRVVRLHAAALERLEYEAGDPRVRAAIVRKLLEAVEDVRTGWQAECRDTIRLAGLDRHVRRGLAGVRAAIAALERPGVDVGVWSADLKEVVVPLLFFLRGLEDCQDDALLAWLTPVPLQRSA